jgi:hypothetical protein
MSFKGIKNFSTNKINGKIFYRATAFWQNVRAQARHGRAGNGRRGARAGAAAAGSTEKSVFAFISLKLVCIMLKNK